MREYNLTRSRSRDGRRPGAQGETPASWQREQSWRTAWRPRWLLSRTISDRGIGAAPSEVALSRRGRTGSAGHLASLRDTFGSDGAGRPRRRLRGARSGSSATDDPGCRPHPGGARIGWLLLREDIPGGELDFVELAWYVAMSLAVGGVHALASAGGVVLGGPCVAYPGRCRTEARRTVPGCPRRGSRVAGRVVDGRYNAGTVVRCRLGIVSPSL
jgi:hypothetical protein